VSCHGNVHSRITTSAAHLLGPFSLPFYVARPPGDKVCVWANRLSAHGGLKAEDHGKSRTLQLDEYRSHRIRRRPARVALLPHRLHSPLRTSQTALLLLGNLCDASSPSLLLFIKQRVPSHSPACPGRCSYRTRWGAKCSPSAPQLVVGAGRCPGTGRVERVRRQVS
jgi:hypothetical protein